MGETGDTGGKGTPNIRVDQSHLRRLIIVFIVHVMDHIQSFHIGLCQPGHHLLIFFHHFFIIQIFRGDGTVFWPHLSLILLVNAAVDGIQKTFGKIGSRPKKLNLFSRLRR